MKYHVSINIESFFFESVLPLNGVYVTNLYLKKIILLYQDIHIYIYVCIYVNKTWGIELTLEEIQAQMSIYQMLNCRKENKKTLNLLNNQAAR